ncbi:alpha/beta fold hydrolase [Nocardia lijiangensis]|uniref:alpha/beta fold hydrolase n=1 Tax=Nocardia lijiangensis TaxID=299618 RepID=UPI000833B589|nr:alpha/beta hydrolase [Nocardia lijiangensis]
MPITNSAKIAAAAVGLSATLAGSGCAVAEPTPVQPTIVLVHGAFAESASWNGVIDRLNQQGLANIAVGNPLRSVQGDADAVRGVVASIDGPVVLVGHSYGGQVISQINDPKVRGLVYVAAFAPEEGETIGELSGKFPGSTLGETLNKVVLVDGSTDLYIQPEKYQKQFAADVPNAQATLDARTQRPLNDRALNGKSGAPSWKALPSWFVYPDADYNIPVAAHRFMAERARARATVEIPGASHALTVSQPDAVAKVIVDAAGAVS